MDKVQKTLLHIKHRRQNPLDFMQNYICILTL
jgi:hypothetical protein